MTSDVHATVDPIERTATITTRFEHSIDVVWTLFSDPVKLARWWGPPGMPMTVDHHDLRPGGSVEVTVRAPGSVIRAHWSILTVEPPRSLRFTFASDGLEPTEIDVSIESIAPTATVMTITARFATEAHFRGALEIGFVDGVARSCESAGSVLGDAGPG
jgi:uncharacterized protein YndB with AHSA1/START domain